MKYVAYGSNINLEQMSYRCPNSEVVEVGVVRGWKLVFNIHADIIKTNDPNDYVPVLVWEIDDYECRNLDFYEGFPSYYVKEIVMVEGEFGKTYPAIVYVMADDRKGIYPPSNEYFNGILDGYKENSISDLKYLYDARNYSIKNKTEYNQYKKRG